MLSWLDDVETHQEQLEHSRKGLPLERSDVLERARGAGIRQGL